METMQALVKSRPEPGHPWEKGLRLAEKPVPNVQKSNDIKVKVVMAAMCGTDVGIYHNSDSVRMEMEHARQDEIITGHEFCGEVLDAGDLARDYLARMVHERFRSHAADTAIQEFMQGRDAHDIAGDIDFLDFLQEHFYITAEMHMVCGVCLTCRTGKGHACQNTRIKGVHEDGIFTSYVVVPAENTTLIRKGEIPPEVIAFMDAFGNAVHITQTTDLMGATLAVLGLGVQGLMASAIARWSGASYIIATDFSNPAQGFTHEKLSEDRFKVAKNLGVNDCVDMALPNSHENLLSVVFNNTNNSGVDVVYEMSGSAKAYNDALDIVRTGGTLSLLGLPNDPVTVDFSEKVIFRDITIKGVIGRQMFHTWETMYRLLRSGMADLLLDNGFVSHKYPLAEYEKAFAAHDRGDAIKVILVPE